MRPVVGDSGDSTKGCPKVFTYKETEFLGYAAPPTIDKQQRDCLHHSLRLPPASLGLVLRTLLRTAVYAHASSLCIGVALQYICS
jgi:hypothetical protein